MSSQVCAAVRAVGLAYISRMKTYHNCYVSVSLNLCLRNRTILWRKKHICWQGALWARGENYDKGENQRI